MGTHTLVGTTVPTIGWLHHSEITEYVATLTRSYPAIRAYGVDGDRESLMLLGSRRALADFLVEEFGLDLGMALGHLDANRVVVGAATDDGSRYDQAKHRRAVA